MIKLIRSKPLVSLLVHISLYIFLLTACDLIENEESATQVASVTEENTSEETKSSQTGTIVINVETNPSGQAGVFEFQGEISGTTSSDGTLVVSELTPGTYATSQIDPAPDFDVSEITCDDGASPNPSSGDTGTLTATINLDAGELVTCTFFNTQRGSAVIQVVTEPGGTEGVFEFSGTPKGTIPDNGTLVVAQLTPGVYPAFQIDPTPDFDVIEINCNDSDSATPSFGNPETRTVIFNIDPGELVICTFVNARQGTAVIQVVTEPQGATGVFEFTGTPEGSVSANGTLVVANLTPGIHSSMQVDPVPDFDVTAITCDDDASANPSFGDARNREVIFNIDPGELVRCTFVNARRGTAVIKAVTKPESSAGIFEFTGTPEGTISPSGTLVVAGLITGPHISYQADPAPEFYVTEIICDDDAGANPSFGDAINRKAIFNIDPGELVRCTFVNSTESSESGLPSGDDNSDLQTGTVVIQVETNPSGQAGVFEFQGEISGTISSDGTLVVSELTPGIYATTQIDPAPDFDVSEITCTDSDSATPSFGNPETRTAIFNVDPGELITCTFVNAQRGTAVIQVVTEPQGATGVFEFTGTPEGSVPANGTLVVANLTPGIHSSMQVDPVPDFDVMAITCDDDASANPSFGDARNREVIFNIDPGELVRCTFVNARRGTAVIKVVTEPEDAEVLYEFSGTPEGAIPSSGTLVVANLTPGIHASMQVNPIPDFELTEITCDDGSTTPSIGILDIQAAIFNIDSGELVTCTFVYSGETSSMDPVSGGGSTSGGGSAPGGSGQDAGINPFTDPETYLPEFPLPTDIPSDAGTYAFPLEGSWSATNFAGTMGCGGMSLSIPASPPESGTLTRLGDGQSILAESFDVSEGAPITMVADPNITGRFTGTIDGTQDGVPITINYFWQVVTEEYIVGYLTSSFQSEGVECSIYRSFELVYLN